MPPTAILLTGSPGCGKTTAIKRILARLSRPAGGFYTEEVRQGGARNGFKIVTLDGREGMLAHVNIHSSARVGRYGVDTRVVDTIVVDSIRRALAEKRLVVIDEIGPMEIFSSAFCQVVVEALASDAMILGTIVKRRNLFADKIKALPNVNLIEVTTVNRDRMVDEVLSQLGKTTTEEK
jgi:nucleoside-triphosphatase